MLCYRLNLSAEESEALRNAGNPFWMQLFVQILLPLVPAVMGLVKST